jgi:hypothetical protein
VIANICPAELLVDPWVVRRFDQATTEQVMEALDLVARQVGIEVAEVRVMPAPAQPGWREHHQKALASGPINQAGLAPLPARHPRADGMSFRIPEELRLYQVAKGLRKHYPRDDTFTLIPLPAVSIPDHTWEPDLLILYRGRCAALEVDGESHRRKHSSDRSRDQLLEEAGVAFVRRIDARDATSDQELRDFLKRVLDKLARG